MTEPGRPGAARLLEDLLPELRAYIRLKCGPLVRAQESSSDLVQSVCREILADGTLEASVASEGAALRGRIFKIAEHKIIDKARYWRRDKRDVGRREPLPSSPDALGKSYARLFTASQELMTREALEQIEAAFDKLPERYKEVILLTRVGGMGYEELGTLMGCNAHSARSLASRAVARLAAVLGPGFLG